MKSFILLCLFCSALAVNVIWEQELAPKVPPNITQQFISNYTLGDPLSNTSYYGNIAVDYIHGGGVWTLNGVSWIPIHILTTFIAHPSPQEDTINLLWYADDLCWNLGKGSLDDVTLFPLAIPAGSTYQGTEELRGQECQVWKFESDKFSANVTMYVNAKVFNPMRIELEAYGDTLSWDFIETIVGAFNPNIYKVPGGLQCQASPFELNKEETVYSRFMNLIRPRQ